MTGHVENPYFDPCSHTNQQNVLQKEIKIQPLKPIY